MSAVKVGEFAPRSVEWHAARAGRIGGSDVAAILGLSPWESRFGIWHRKAGLLTDEIEDTPVMEWGRRLEPVILAKFAEDHLDLTVGPSATYQHADRPWQIANPDAVAFTPADEVELVEAKTARFDDGWGEPGSDEVPIHYRVQALWYLDVLDADVCHLPVLIAGSDYREYLIRYDAAEAAEIRGKVAEFLESIETGHRPDIDEHTATYSAIKAMHPNIDTADVDLDGDLARRYVAAKAAEKRAKAETQTATSLVADAMGTASRALWDSTVIARRQARGDGLPYVVAGRGLDQLAAILDEGEGA